MLQHLFHEGLYCKGLFRQTPKASTVRELRDRLDAGENVNFLVVSPYATASVLKVLCFDMQGGLEFLLSFLRCSISFLCLELCFFQEFLRSMPDCLLTSEKFATWLFLTEIADEIAKIAKAKQYVCRK